MAAFFTLGGIVKRLIVSLALLLLFGIAGAEMVDMDTAASIGSGFFGFKGGGQDAEYEIEPYFGGSSLSPDFYILRFQPRGFVLVAAEAQATPILGYDLDSVFPEAKLPAHISWYLEQYSLSIQEIRNHPEWSIDPHWAALQQEDYSAYQDTRNVTPILTTTWDQDWPYNYMCPNDGSGPGGHVLVGSIPTAMAQVMKRWNQPVTGTGSHSYNSPGYGYQSANFGATTYNWAGMPNSTATVNTAIATLLYHCGVAVEAQYSAEGSGAYPEDVVYALVHYFGYHGSAELLNASEYNASTWATMLRTDLNLGRPVFYGGTNASVGHAFVLDGYSGTNYFHVNWGWSGLYDGYFYLNNLNPGSVTFNLNQRAIFHVYHPAEPYHDLACNSLSGPNSAWVNLPGTFTASVTNEGMVTQTAYSVRLMRDGGILLDSVAGTTLISGATRNFELNWTPLAAGNYSLYAEVVLPSDTNPDNDTSPTIDLNCAIQATDPPSNVIATEISSTSVNISWNAPPSRVLQGYRVWRLFWESQSSDSTWISITPNPITSCTCIDTDFYNYPGGNYCWAVKAVYEGQQMSAPAFSNVLNIAPLAGLLTGMVSTLQNIPISGATISCGDFSATTNASGEYSLAVSPGTYFVSANHPYYEASAQAGVVVELWQTTTLNFQLLPLAIEQNIGLEAGWNLASLNVSPPVHNVYELISDIAVNLQQIKGTEGIYMPANPYSTLSNLADGSAYYIKMVNAASWNVQGDLIPPNTPLPLAAGWNMTAFLPQESMPVITAISSLGSRLLQVKDIGGFYIPGHAGSTLTNMYPGRGYLIDLNEAYNLIYPTGRHSIREFPHPGTPLLQHHRNPAPLSSSMTVLARCDTASVGDFLLAKVDGDLRGKELLIGPEGFPAALIQIYTESIGEEINFSILKPDATEIPLATTLLSEPHAIIGNYPEFVNLYPLPSHEEDTLAPAIGLSGCYPNPFSQSTILTYAVDKAQVPVFIGVYNLKGQLVRCLTDQIISQGTYQQSWDGKDSHNQRVSSGLYFISMQMADYRKTIKVLLSK